MSSKHKQSKNRKNNHSRSHRRNKNNSKQHYLPAIISRTKQTIHSHNFPSYIKKLSEKNYISAFLNSLKEDTKLYQDYKNTKNILPKNLLTQIQRKTNTLEQKLDNPSLNKNQSKIFRETYEDIKYILNTQGYNTKLKSLEKQMKKQELKKDPNTNHYPQKSFQ